MRVPYSYLAQQFDEIDSYLADIRSLVRSGDFTLGAAVAEFEQRFADLCGLPYAIGVSSGTDALAMSLESIGVGHGDEVITTPNTFVATVGAIVMTGARPVFVDNNEEYTIDSSRIEEAITAKTKAILPVHLTGIPADMPAIMEIANRNGIKVVEDAAQAILASIDGKHVGSWGETAGFSLHPLKNLNVWGDGGVIVTRSAEIAERLKLMRNHGLSDRDTVVEYGQNSRLDSLQAVVGNRLIGEANPITDARIANAKHYDQGLADLGEHIVIPTRKPGVKQVYHTYVIQVADRTGLLGYLESNEIEAKVHYPIPLHLQEASQYLGYTEGDFPVCERHCETILSLPVHQHLCPDQLDWVIDRIHGFYSNKIGS